MFTKTMPLKALYQPKSRMAMYTLKCCRSSHSNQGIYSFNKHDGDHIEHFLQFNLYIFPKSLIFENNKWYFNSLSFHIIETIDISNRCSLMI